MALHTQAALTELAKREETQASPPTAGILPVFHKQKREDSAPVTGVHSMDISALDNVLLKPSFAEDLRCVAVQHSKERNTIDNYEDRGNEYEPRGFQSNGWLICQPIAIETDSSRFEQADTTRPPLQIRVGSSTARLFLPVKPSVSVSVKLTGAVSMWTGPRGDMPTPAHPPANAIFKARVRLLKRGSTPYPVNGGRKNFPRKSWLIESTSGVSQSYGLPVFDLHPVHSYQIQLPALCRLGTPKIAVSLSKAAMAPNPLERNGIHNKPQAEPLKLEGQTTAIIIENRPPRLMLETSDPVRFPFIVRQRDILDQKIKPSCQPALADNHYKTILPAVPSGTGMPCKIVFFDQLLFESVMAPIGWTICSRPHYAEAHLAALSVRIDPMGKLRKRLASFPRLPASARPTAFRDAPDNPSRPAVCSVPVEFNSTITPPCIDSNREIHRLRPWDLLRLTDACSVLDSTIPHWSHCSTFASIAMPLRLQRPATGPSKDKVVPTKPSYSGIRISEADCLIAPQRTPVIFQSLYQTVLRGDRPAESRIKMDTIDRLPLEESDSGGLQPRGYIPPVCWTPLRTWPLFKSPPRSALEAVVSIAVGLHIPRAL